MKGNVTTVTDFGVFVKFWVKVKDKKAEVEGLVHSSEIAWEEWGTGRCFKGRRQS